MGNSHIRVGALKVKFTLQHFTLITWKIYLIDWPSQGTTWVESTLQTGLLIMNVKLDTSIIIFIYIFGSRMRSSLVLNSVG